MQRLDKLLSSLGYASRRDVAGLCKSGRVRDRAGNLLTRPETRVDPADVLLEGKELDHRDGIFIVLHKPVGYTCSHDASEGDLVYDLLPDRWWSRNPVPSSIGRLDKDTSGVLLITDHGQWIHRLASPKHHVEKIYLATLERPLDAATIEAFASGTLMLAEEKSPCLPAKVEADAAGVARVTMTEGRYHQVRRMFAACGNHVLALHREAFGPYGVADLAPGEWQDVPDPAGKLWV